MGPALCYAVVCREGWQRHLDDLGDAAQRPMNGLEALRAWVQDQAEPDAVLDAMISRLEGDVQELARRAGSLVLPCDGCCRTCVKGLGSDPPQENAT